MLIDSSHVGLGWDMGLSFISRAGPKYALSWPNLDITPLNVWQLSLNPSIMGGFYCPPFSKEYHHVVFGWTRKYFTEIHRFTFG